MTKKKFKYAMQRGLGRCIMELKCADDVERYKDIVLWACTHETTYDGQSEGSRSFYLYEMIREFPDVMPFLQASAKKMDQCVGTMGWKFAENCQLLALFAAERNKFALQALRQCYGELLNTLKRKRKRTGHGLMPELDNFEELCISMATYSSKPSICIKEFLIIAEDIGELIENNPLLSSPEHKFYVIDMLSVNYHKQDRASFVNLIKSIPIAYEEGEWRDEACNDPKCPFCSTRPKTPYEVYWEMDTERGSALWRKNWRCSNYHRKKDGERKHADKIKLRKIRSRSIRGRSIV